MLKIVKLNPNKLNYMNSDGSMVSIPRPSAIPFNVINMNKIKAAGYANGITMVIFMDDKFKPANEIHFFRMVPNDIVEGLINVNYIEWNSRWSWYRYHRTIWIHVIQLIRIQLNNFQHRILIIWIRNLFNFI